MHFLEQSGLSCRGPPVGFELFKIQIPTGGQKGEIRTQKLFILENGRYTEISYPEFISRKESNEHYKDKLFLPMRGMLMEVKKETYNEYYREKRRQKYIDERARLNGEILYDSLSKEEFNGEDILIDPLP